MRIAFVIFNKMTALDFIGIYDPLTRLRSMGFWPDLEWDVCAYTEQVQDDRGLGFVPAKVGHPLEGYDLLVVPGGYGTRELQSEASFMSWLQTAAGCPLKVSVCSGSLLLGAAGFLEGKRATSHRDAQADLAPYCAEVLDKRVVDDGDVITARGVTSGLDLGLYLVEKLAGREIKQQIQRQMDYPYEMQL